MPIDRSRATKVPLDNVVPLGYFATLCKKKNTSGELRRWPKLPIKIFVSQQILVSEKKCRIRPTPFTSAYPRNEPSYRHVSLGSSSYCRAKLLTARFSCTNFEKQREEGRKPVDFPRFQLFEREAAKSCRMKQLVSRGPTLATNSQLLSALVIQRHAAKHLLSPRCIHRPVHTKRVLAHGTHVKVCTYVGKVAVQCARSARHVVYRAPWSMGATRPSGSAESRLNSLIHATGPSYSQHSLRNEAICRSKSIGLRWDKIRERNWITKIWTTHFSELRQLRVRWEYCLV